MILADKIIELRKKHGWSQEELAEKMNVTRQSVSKWEGEQSVPDIEKIIKLSELFEVSTDYLLKGDIETYNVEEKQENVRRVTIKEAEKFLRVKNKTSKMVAAATFLCILSPCSILISAVTISMTDKYSSSENIVVSVGMIIMFILVAAAVAIFIYSGTKTSEFAFLEKESFEPERGLIETVKDYREKYKNTYIRNTIVGVSACILSIVPIFIGIIINGNKDLLTVCMVVVFFLIVGAGVALIIRSGIIHESFKKLLQEGEYSRQEKEEKGKKFEFSSAYWLIVTAIYLTYSFATQNWGNSWMIWPVAGVLYLVCIYVGNFISRRIK